MQPFLPQLLRLENKSLHCAGRQDLGKGDPGCLLTQIHACQRGCSASVTAQRNKLLYTVCFHEIPQPGRRSTSVCLHSADTASHAYFRQGGEFESLSRPPVQQVSCKEETANNPAGRGRYRVKHTSSESCERHQLV